MIGVDRRDPMATAPAPDLVGAAGVMIVDLVEEALWLRRLIAWCRPRLKHPSYQTWLDQYLAAGPSPAPLDEPPIVRSEVAETEPHD